MHVKGMELHHNVSNLLKYSVNLTSNLTFSEDGVNASTVGTSQVQVEVHTGPPSQGLPIPLLIASPVAAVSILIFVCIAYYCHAAQLDERARQMAIRMASGQTEMTKSVTTMTIIEPSNETDYPIYTKRERRSTLKPPPTPSPSFLGPKRTSVNWGAMADHELVSYSPRRHSTFII